MTTTPKNTTPLPRWTDDDVKILRQTVRAAKNKQEGFKKAAEKLGKKPGTVQQKWYNLEAKKNPKRKPVSAKPVASRNGGPDLGAMENSDLAALAKAVQVEVERRRKQLEEAAGLFA